MVEHRLTALGELPLGEELREGTECPTIEGGGLHARYGTGAAFAGDGLEQFEDVLDADATLDAKGKFAHTFAIEGFLPTGAGAHGLYPSRDARSLYVTNRAAGTISVIDFSTRRIVHTWTIPGGTPDMGGVSADGKVLWLSGRGSASVYAISTGDGHVIATIPVGNGPHGLCVWPQPGRYSLGHTGNMR